MTKKETMCGALMWFELETGVLLVPKKKLCTGALIQFELQMGGFLVKIFCVGFLFSFLSNLGRKYFGRLGEKTPYNCVCFSCIGNQENILHRAFCLGCSKNLVKPKSHSLTVKYVGLQCKIDYTSILLSNHFQPRQRERERGLIIAAV